MNAPNPDAPKLKLFSVVIPARDEEESLPATLEHLHLEFTLNNVPHEIVVVDDGSKDKTWEVLQQLKAKIPELRPIQNTGEHGFGRAIMNAAEEWLRQAGISKLQLLVRPENTRVQAFYESIGYDEQERIIYAKWLDGREMTP